MMAHLDRANQNIATHFSIKKIQTKIKLTANCINSTIFFFSGEMTKICNLENLIMCKLNKIITFKKFIKNTEKELSLIVSNDCFHWTPSSSTDLERCARASSFACRYQCPETGVMCTCLVVDRWTSSLRGGRVGPVVGLFQAVRHRRVDPHPQSGDSRAAWRQPVPAPRREQVVWIVTWLFPPVFRLVNQPEV